MADAVVHGLGVAAGLVGLVVLIAVVAPRYDIATGASLWVYGFAMLTVFCFSAAYNLINDPTWTPRLRRLDRAAIYVKIAGTYTPFSAIAIGGGVGAGLLGAAWSIAAIGVPIALFASERLERLTVWLYLAQGWLLVFVLEPISAALPLEALVLLISGGLLYTAGVPFHLWERLPYHNAIWHGFVLAASVCMYAAILSGMPPALA
ncbi:MAG: hemolysin III family protein [Pseudomonadota bacterium]